MAAATSPATGEAYGVKRVCTIWGVARSSFYDARRQEVQLPERPDRRGPKPARREMPPGSAATWRARRGRRRAPQDLSAAAEERRHRAAAPACCGAWAEQLLSHRARPGE